MSLNHPSTRIRHARFSELPARQRGITLLITLIVLVSMTLAAISLMRSVDTTNVIAGNLAFRQSATSSGDVGVESAIYWLEQHNDVTLFTSQPGTGYSAIHEEPAPNQTWDQWWNVVATTRKSGVFTLPSDPATGNTVSYTIDRLCQQEVDPLAVGANCEQTSATGKAGGSQTSGAAPLITSTQIYYRITSRTDGPHNSVSYVQSIIAL